MATSAPVVKLPKPVWFDTGLKMADGITPRTIAAYDAKQLNDYREKKSVVGLNEDGTEKLLLWQPIGPVESISAPKAVEGVTATTGNAKR